MMERNSSECLLKKLDEEIVLLDGAMGTMISVSYTHLTLPTTSAV